MKHTKLNSSAIAHQFINNITLLQVHQETNSLIWFEHYGHIPQRNKTYVLPNLSFASSILNARRDIGNCVYEF